jgi:hypothetical protein
MIVIRSCRARCTEVNRTERLAMHGTTTTDNHLRRCVNHFDSRVSNWPHEVIT